jgi:hypothetical protein
MITFLEEDEEAIVVLVVLDVLEVDGDEQVAAAKRKQKASKQTYFLLKSENKNHSNERNH